MEENKVQFDYSVSRRFPYIRSVRERTSDSITFDGYFYLEDNAMPVEQMLYTSEGIYHIEIIQKQTCLDTSVYSPDEENGNICFFPTAILYLKYRILKQIESEDERQAIFERIKSQQDELEARNAILQQERERREREEYLSRITDDQWRTFLKRFH